MLSQSLYRQTFWSGIMSSVALKLRFMKEVIITENFYFLQNFHSSLQVFFIQLRICSRINLMWLLLYRYLYDNTQWKVKIYLKPNGIIIKEETFHFIHPNDFVAYTGSNQIQGNEIEIGVWYLFCIYYRIFINGFKSVISRDI